MKLLKERILSDGRCLQGGVLKVDNFINHQIEPVLMFKMAQEFVERFKGTEITKVMTVESSGIAPAVIVGYLMNKPVLFAKKRKPSTMENMFVTEVFSFTKNQSYTVCVSKEYLYEDDKVLFVDDFLANGNAGLGIIDLLGQAGAQIAGMGFIIEKAFQNGGKLLRDKGIRVESLAIIDSLDNCKIILK